LIPGFLLKFYKAITPQLASGFVSCLSIFELKKLMLKGAIDKKSTDVILEDIKDFCEIIWIDEEKYLITSSRISHGNHIPAIDSIIIGSLIDSKVKIFYTTDSHFNSYKKNGFSIVML
jgi:hypothetical protein